MDNTLENFDTYLAGNSENASQMWQIESFIAPYAVNRMDTSPMTQLDILTYSTPSPLEEDADPSLWNLQIPSWSHTEREMDDGMKIDVEPLGQDSASESFDPPHCPTCCVDGNGRQLLGSMAEVQRMKSGMDTSMPSSTMRDNSWMARNSLVQAITERLNSI